MPVEGKPLALLGESDRELCTILAGILERQGIAVIVKNTPDEFLDSLDRHHAAVDLVCINGSLASQRGGLLISKAKDASKNVKVVVVAEKDDQRADILRYGADEFMKASLPGCDSKHNRGTHCEIKVKRVNPHAEDRSCH